MRYLIGNAIFKNNNNYIKCYFLYKVFANRITLLDVVLGPNRYLLYHKPFLISNKNVNNSLSNQSLWQHLQD